MKMHMRKREKVGVAAAMTMGYMYVFSLAHSPPPATDSITNRAAITGFVRCTKIPGMKAPDFTCMFTPFVVLGDLQASLLTPNLDEGAALINWGAGEVAATIMAASLPFLRVLVQEATSSAEARYEPQLEYELPQQREDNKIRFDGRFDEGRSAVMFQGMEPAPPRRSRKKRSERRSRPPSQKQDEEVRKTKWAVRTPANSGRSSRRRRDASGEGTGGGSTQDALP